MQFKYLLILSAALLVATTHVDAYKHDDACSEAEYDSDVEVCSDDGKSVLHCTNNSNGLASYLWENRDMCSNKCMFNSTAKKPECSNP